MAEGTILVVGTSRRDGNTFGLVRRANKGLGFPVVDVSESVFLASTTGHAT